MLLSDFDQFIEIARRTKEICDKVSAFSPNTDLLTEGRDQYQVPVLINDRIDVHLAVGETHALPSLGTHANIAIRCCWYTYWSDGHTPASRPQALGS